MAPPAAAGALKTKSKEFYDIIRLIGASQSTRARCYFFFLAFSLSLFLGLLSLVFFSLL